MAEALGEAVLELTTTIDQFKREMAAARTEAVKVEDQFKLSAKKIGDSMTRIGGLMTKFVTLPILGGFVAATKAASDLNESVNAVNVVFGQSARVITDWTRNAAGQIGVTTTQANQALTVMGGMLQNAGIAAEDAARQSLMLTTRAADMASVFNTDVNQALNAINAALRGEIDPIERFAVSMNQATLEAAALEMGINKSVTEMTLQEKAMVRVSVIMDQTAKLEGDFARTQGDTANSMKTLTAQIGNLAAEIGQKLLPIAKDILTWARDFVDRISKIPPEMIEMGLKLAAFVAIAGPAVLVIGNLVKGIAALAPVVSSLAATMGLAGAVTAGPALLVGVLVAMGVALAVIVSRAREAGDAMDRLPKPMMVEAGTPVTVTPFGVFVGGDPTFAGMEFSKGGVTGASTAGMHSAPAGPEPTGRAATPRTPGLREGTGRLDLVKAKIGGALVPQLPARTMGAGAGGAGFLEQFGMGMGFVPLAQAATQATAALADTTVDAASAFRMIDREMDGYGESMSSAEVALAAFAAEQEKNLGTWNTLVPFIQIGMTAMEGLGKAWAQSGDAAASFEDALRRIAVAMVQQIPTIFLQMAAAAAGQGNWPAALGFLALAGVSAVAGGFLGERLRQVESGERDSLFGKETVSTASASGGGGGVRAQTVNVNYHGVTFTNEEDLERAVASAR